MTDLLTFREHGSAGSDTSLGLAPSAAPAAARRSCECDGGLLIDLGLKATDLASVRFAADSVWETVASLGVLRRPDRHRLHHRLRERVGDPRYDLNLLLDLVSLDCWLPTFLCSEPTRPSQPPERALTAVADTDLHLVHRDLATLRELAPTHRRWRQMSADQLRHETSAALLGYWRHVLLPLWERITEIVEADLDVRGRQLTSLGLGATLRDLHDDLSLHEHRLRVRRPGHHRHQTSRGVGLWFVPTVFRWPGLVVQTDRPVPVVGYPARGAGRLWETGTSKDSVGLRQVLGGSRVDILIRLHTPTTTTRLARDLGLSPGTVSTHLTAMTRAGFLEATRRGREVCYRRTTLGDSLVTCS